MSVIEELRSLHRDIEPRRHETAIARSALRMAIAEETGRRRRFRPRTAVSRNTLAAVGAAVAVFLAVLVVPAIVRPVGVTASAVLQETAAATEMVAVPQLPPGLAWYRTIHEQGHSADFVEGLGEVSFRNDIRQEQWLNEEVVRTITRFDEPRFDNPAAAAAWHDGEFPEFFYRQLDEPEDIPVLAASTDRPESAAHVAEFVRRQALLQGENGLPQSVKQYREIESLLIDPMLSREIRAEALRVLASIDGIELVSHDDAQVTVSISYTDPSLGAVTATTTIDRPSGFLTRRITQLHDGVLDPGAPDGVIFPAGINFDDISYSIPQLVADLDTRP